MNKSIKEILEIIDKISEEYNIKIYKKKIDLNLQLKGVSSLFDYKENTITWLRNQETLEKHEIKKKISLIIVPQGIEKKDYFLNYIETDKPQNLFSLLVEKIYEDMLIKKENGKNSVISEKSQISGEVIIGNNCTIEEDVIIGKGTIIGNNVIIKRKTIIGEDCLIQSGAIIGEDGFGFIELDNKIKRRMPHLGGVKIGNGVEIGANTCIVRGTLYDTIIEDYVKIDNLCHIAHNVRIGRNSFIVAHTLIGGSVTIGENCWVSTSNIRNLLTIEDDSFIGIGSTVVKNVKKNTMVYGNPAKEKEKK